MRGVKTCVWGEHTVGEVWFRGCTEGSGARPSRTWPGKVLEATVGRQEALGTSPGSCRSVARGVRNHGHQGRSPLGRRPAGSPSCCCEPLCPEAGEGGSGLRVTHDRTSGPGGRTSEVQSVWTPEAHGGRRGDTHTGQTPRPALGSWQLGQGMLWARRLLAKGTWGSRSNMSSTYPAAPHGTFWKEAFCYIPSMALQPPTTPPPATSSFSGHLPAPARLTWRWAPGTGRSRGRARRPRSTTKCRQSCT